MFWLRQAAWGGFFVAAASAAVWAAEEKKADPAAAAPEVKAAADNIAQWIKQLDADKFADRQAASEKLFEAGKAAVPSLTEAATGDSLEVTIRSIDLLQRFLDSDDKSIQAAAKEGLEKIAQSDKSGAARRARQVLNPNEDQQPQGPMGGLNMGRVQLQFGGLPGGGMNMKSVNITENNGVKQINAEEGDRKIKITKNADESIKMEITEKVNGKDQTKKFSAKNADELKKKSPKAYETYKEYAEDNAMGGMLQLNIGGGAMGPGVIPPMPAMPAMPAMPPMPALPPQLGKIPGIQILGPGGALNGSNDLGESLKNWNESLKTMSDDLEPDKLSPEEKKELKARIDEFKKQLDKLHRRLQKPAEKPAK